MLLRNILELFSVFLACEQCGGKVPEDLDFTINAASAELLFTLESCMEQLKKIINSLANSNLFQGSDNLSRWSFCYDIITKFRGGPQLLTEVFENPRRDASPVVAQRTAQSEDAS
jgi:hypothetical protein